ncbi:MAG: glycosyltransferase family 4 protein [Actinomycetota bacterium]
MALVRVAYDAAPLLGPLTGVGHYALALLEHLLALEEGLYFNLMAVALRADRTRVPVNRRLRLRHIRFPSRVAVVLWDRLGHPRGELLSGDADVFHGTNYWVPPLRRAAGIVTIHDLTFWLHPELTTPQVRRYRRIVPRVLRRCALALTPCETIRDQLASELSFPKDRILAIPEGVRGVFAEARASEALLERLGVRGDFLLFAGTREPRKNLGRLLRALPLVDEDLRLVLAGPEGWGDLDLPGLARRLRVEDRVIFCGYLGDRDLAALMATCRAFVFPTLYEGFGLPPLEAMAAGAPVVASRAGSLPEVLGDAPFYCDPFEVESIAGAIARAVGDETARRAAMEAGKARAAGYRWEETARRTMDAYRLVAGGA